MKLSNETINVLKNFSAINQSILLKEGNVLKTISPQKTVMGIATVPDHFPRQVGIYNLSRFLAIYSLMGPDTEISFGENFLTASHEQFNVKYLYTNPEMIISPPDTEIKMQSIDFTASLSSADLQKVLRAASAMQLPEIAFFGENGSCSLRALDSSNPLADYFEIRLGDTPDTFCLVVKAENLQIMPLDYKVHLSSKGISKFESANVSYYIAIETKSTYKKGN
jgi:hypothetical protein